jgi:putative membrane protein
MKKNILLICLVAAAGLFQACNGNHSGKSGDSTKSTADSTKISDTAKTAGTATTNPDTAFANKAAVGGMAEVALGKLALSKSSDSKIKQFANQMVTDHGKANDELAGIAKNKNITLPATVDAEHQAKMDSLSKLSGAEFNKAYVMAMIAGHKKTLDLMQNEASGGQDADLKAFAAKTAPVVKMHLDMINKIHDSMK